MGNRLKQGMLSLVGQLKANLRKRRKYTANFHDDLQEMRREALVKMIDVIREMEERGEELKCESGEGKQRNKVIDCWQTLNARAAFKWFQN